VDRQSVVLGGIVIGVSVGLGVLVWLALLASRRLRVSAERRLQEILERFRPDPAASCGPDVEVLCYAYYGVLASLTTVTIRRRLPLDQANDLLDQIHRFNLRWGWCAAGGAFVPIASMLRRWQQRRSFRQQLAALAAREKRSS
jgi:hypothetical protein